MTLKLKYMLLQLPFLPIKALYFVMAMPYRANENLFDIIRKKIECTTL